MLGAGLVFGAVAIASRSTTPSAVPPDSPVDKMVAVEHTLFRRPLGDDVPAGQVLQLLRIPMPSGSEGVGELGEQFGSGLGFGEHELDS